MKASNRFESLTIKVFSLVLLFLGLVYGVKVMHGHAVKFRTESTSYDLMLRYNECACAHSGVNPYHVWNHDVVSEVFRGHRRPDMDYDLDVKKRIVHCYTPWHVTYTWLYGFMSFPHMAAYFYMLEGMLLLAMFRYLQKRIANDDKMFVWSMLIFELAIPVVWCHVYGNYGIVLCALMAALICLSDRKREITAGVVFGLMLIKPQVSLLLVFPLMFQRRLKSVFVAGAICMFATLWPAYVYSESPIDLILQIPRIGGPYGTTVDFVSAFGRMVGRQIPGIVWMCACVMACAYFSWRLRKCEYSFVRYAPAAFFFTYWTYSNQLDLMVGWPFLLTESAIILAMLRGQDRAKRILACAYLIARICIFVGIGLIGAMHLCTQKIVEGLFCASHFLSFVMGVYVLLILPSMQREIRTIIPYRSCLRPHTSYP